MLRTLPLVLRTRHIHYQSLLGGRTNWDQVIALILAFRPFAIFSGACLNVGRSRYGLVGRFG